MRSTGGPTLQLDSLHTAVTALIVAVDRSVPEDLESTLRADPQLEVRTATSVGTMLEQLESVDCLVLVPPGPFTAGDSTTSDGTATSAAPESSSSDTESAQSPTAADTLERIRSHVPERPIVVLTASTDRDVSSASEPEPESRSELGPEPETEPEPKAESKPSFASTRCPQRWTVHVPVEWTDATELERVSRRVRHLVERHRLEGLSRRALAGIELAQEPIALVDPDGEIEFTNRLYAMQFGYDRATLQGQSWQSCFSDDSVSQLESTAIPTVSDGWRWTGHSTGQRRSGQRFPVRVRLDGLEDGSLVFVVTELESSDGSDSDADADADANTDTDTDADESENDR